MVGPAGAAWSRPVQGLKMMSEEALQAWMPFVIVPNKLAHGQREGGLVVKVVYDVGSTLPKAFLVIFRLSLESTRRFGAEYLPVTLSVM